MSSIVREAGTLIVACAQLVAVDKERSGEENITLILARLDGPALPALELDADRIIRVGRL